MDLSKTALILIGFQNDYFSEAGILHAVIEESSRVTGVLQNTVNVLRDHGEKFAMVVSTPIVFTESYEELSDPVGILKTIKDVGAFRAGSPGSEVIAEFDEFDFIQEVPGKRGLNAFSNTDLEARLRRNGVEHIVLAGTVTSICIDSTGRSAAERGFKVTVLNDCTSGRTVYEQDFYCEQVFPLYAECCNRQDMFGQA